MDAGRVRRYGRPVRARLTAVLADPWVQRGGDLLLAVAVLGASLAEIGAGKAEWVGAGRAVAVLLAVVSAVPLVWRRRLPLAVGATTGVALLVEGAIAAPTQGPFEGFVAFVVAAYSVGRYAPRLNGAALLGAASAAGTVTWVVLREARPGTAWGDWFPILVWLWGFWLVGRVVGDHSRRTAQLERLTLDLAAERDARAREAVTVERARIARELHDVVAHNISVMSVQAAAGRRVLEGEGTVVHDALRAIEETARATVDEMRRMLGVLRADGDELGLAPQPGLDALTPLVAQMREAGLPVELRVEGDPVALPAGLELSAYRIVQEALTNALKYGGTAHAWVSLQWGEEELELEVANDGRGDGDGSGGGHGLAGMRERVQLYGGTLDSGPRDGGGYVVRARLPVTAS